MTRSLYWKKMGLLEHLSKFPYDNYTTHALCGYLGTSRKGGSKYTCKLCREIENRRMGQV